MTMRTNRKLCKTQAGSSEQMLRRLNEVYGAEPAERELLKKIKTKVSTMKVRVEPGK
jgi:hypothetical protein